MQKVMIISSIFALSCIPSVRNYHRQEKQAIHQNRTHTCVQREDCPYTEDERNLRRQTKYDHSHTKSHSRKHPNGRNHPHAQRRHHRRGRGF